MNDPTPKLTSLVDKLCSNNPPAHTITLVTVLDEFRALAIAVSEYGGLRSEPLIALADAALQQAETIVATATERLN